MSTMTTGTYLIYETVAPTSAWDPSAHTEGTDYVRLNGSPQLTWNVSFNDGVIDLPGGWALGIALGDFSETFSIADVATETQMALLRKWFKRNSQPPYNSQLYCVVVLNDTPTLQSWYADSATAYEYVPIYISQISSTWDVKTQIHRVNVMLKAVWGT
jgi:hypothetical protein